jgi:hypothetical protein
MNCLYGAAESIPSGLDATLFLTSSGRTPNNGKNHSLVQKTVQNQQPGKKMYREVRSEYNVLGSRFGPTHNRSLG